MTLVHATIHDIPSDAYLLDAYGVFWHSNSVGPLPNSKEAMRKLVLDGKIVGILSNSSQRAESEIQKIAKHGLIQGTHFHFFVTSGEVAIHTFKHNTLPFKTLTNKYWIFGKGHPRYSAYTYLFENSPFSETDDITKADFIYVCVPHIDGEDQTDPHVFYQELMKLAKNGLWMVCANPDHFAHEGSRIVVRQGSIAALYEQLGGQVLYIGKPYATVYSHCMEHFKNYGITKASQVLMVGDTVETDIRGARAFQMKSALILKTGITASRLETEKLEELIAQDTPDYLLEQLGCSYAS